MIKFPSDIIPCLPRSGYTVGRASSFYVLRTLKGRARYRYRDSYDSYLINVTLNLDVPQYSTWQGFYKAINYGADQFWMDLDFGWGVETRSVHLTDGPVSTLQNLDRWMVQLSIEGKVLNT